jgi:PAS domain-containing protein
MTPWIALLVVIGIGILVQLLVLRRQRRLFLLDPQRRRFFLGYVQGRAATPPQPRPHDPRLEPALQTEPPAPNASIPAARDSARVASSSESGASDEAVVYVDATGQCTFANQAARELLHWSTGNLALRDVLAGGRGESDALMESLARRGLVEQHPSTLAGPTRAALEINAVAVRDRDDNLWGAALFIRRAAGAPAAGGHSRRASSRH